MAIFQSYEPLSIKFSVLLSTVFPCRVVAEEHTKNEFCSNSYYGAVVKLQCKNCWDVCPDLFNIKCELMI